MRHYDTVDTVTLAPTIVDVLSARGQITWRPATRDRVSPEGAADANRNQARGQRSVF